MLYSRGTLAMFQKQLSAAQQLFAEALNIFTADENVHGQALVLRNAAIVDRLLGNFDSMLGKYEDALAMMRTVGDVIGQANILRNLSKYRIDQGDIEEAAQMLSEALQLCQQVNYVRGEAQVASRFAELYLSTGQPILARQTLNRVLESVRQIGDRIGEAHALYGLGVVRRREGRLDTAEATLLHALSVAEEVGDRLIQGQAHYAIGELCLARGENDKAAEHLQRARQLFDELGSSLWLAKTLIQLLEAGEAGGCGPGCRRHRPGHRGACQQRFEGGRPAAPLARGGAQRAGLGPGVLGEVLDAVLQPVLSGRGREGGAAPQLLTLGRRKPSFRRPGWPLRLAWSDSVRSVPGGVVRADRRHGQRAGQAHRGAVQRRGAWTPPCWSLPVSASAWAGPATATRLNVPAASATMVMRTRFLLTSTSPKKLFSAAVAADEVKARCGRYRTGLRPLLSRYWCWKSGSVGNRKSPLAPWRADNFVRTHCGGIR